MAFMILKLFLQNVEEDGSDDADKNPGLRVEKDDKDKYDIEYNVIRPTKPPVKGCDDDDKDDVECEKKVLEPYKKWPSYKKWRKTKTPLFILIFGGCDVLLLLAGNQLYQL